MFKSPSREKRSGNGVLKNMGLLCAFMVFFLLGAEVTLRILFPETPDAHEESPKGILCESHPLFGWIGRPNVSGRLPFSEDDMDDMHVMMNGDGFWDNHHTAEKPPGVKRILFLGDSFTIGYGIDRSMRFMDVIKHRLPPEYEMINMGMWGFSTDQEFLVLEEKGLEYNPDVVVLSMFLDDLFCCRLVSLNDGLYVKPRFSLDAEDDLELGNVPVPGNRSRSLLLNVALSAVGRFRNRMEVGAGFLSKGWYSVFDKDFLEQKGYHLGFRLLREIYLTSKAHHAKFLLVIVPWKDQVHRHEIAARGQGWAGIPAERLDLSVPQEMVNAYCEKTGIPVLDLLPVFTNHHAPDTLFFKEDFHWTEAGHRLAAEQIWAHLGRLDYLQDGTGESN